LEAEAGQLSKGAAATTILQFKVKQQLHNFQQLSQPATNELKGRTSEQGKRKLPALFPSPWKHTPLASDHFEIKPWIFACFTDHGSLWKKLAEDSA
jgi:hypothetical protein